MVKQKRQAKGNVGGDEKGFRTLHFNREDEAVRKNGKY